MPVKGLIFDLDGLLFNTEEIYYESSQKVADEMQLPYSRKTYLKYLGLSDEELWGSYHRDFAEFGEKMVAEFIKKSYEETLHIFHEGDVPLKKGAQELLTWSQEQEIPCVIASSNNRKTIELLLERGELREFFGEIFSAENVTYAKPHPELVEKAATFFSAPKKDLVMLEDSLNGVTASFAAGVPVILVPDLLAPTPEMEKMASHILPDLLAVKNFLAEN